MKRIIINKIKKIVKKKLYAESSGHDYGHCYRVAQMAVKIGKVEKADIFVLELAGYLHDITSTNKRSDHNITGAEQAAKIMVELGINKEIIEKVKKCIINHRYTKGKKTNLSLEEKIIQDSDKLDVLGAIGIARIFSFAGKYNILMHDPQVKPNPANYLLTGKSTSALNLFQEKIFLLADLFHTKSAKKIAQEREKYMRGFEKRFNNEWLGLE